MDESKPFALWPDCLSDEQFRQVVSGLALQPLAELVKLAESVEGETGEPSALPIRADLVVFCGTAETRSTLIGVADPVNRISVTGTRPE